MLVNKDIIPREIYLKKLRSFYNQPELIKVITGQRRVGKSYLLYQIMAELKENNLSSNVIFINPEMEEFHSVTTSQALLKYIKDATQPGTNYVFIDEIQEIREFEKALNDLQIRGNYDIYCTGSNAKMLSGEISTLLSGRYIEVTVRSLVYSEFLEFQKMKKGKESFDAYIRYGGLPYLKNLELKDEIVFEYIRNIYHTILYKDILSRHQIRNVQFLENLIYFLADHTGSVISATSISKYLKSQQLNVTAGSIIKYIRHLEEAYFIQSAKRTAIKGKKVFQSGEKYYFEDLGLRHSILKFREYDIHKVLENLVYHHLIVHGYSVSVGIDHNREIDFVAEKQNSKIYVQVTYLLHEEKTKLREIGNLKLIHDNYSKYVVTLDPYIKGNIDGIEIIHVIDFLKLISK